MGHVITQASAVTRCSTAETALTRPTAPSDAVVASFNAITESVFHVGTSVTMMMTVETRVMNRTALTLHVEELTSLAPVVVVYIRSGCAMERTTVETMLMSEAVIMSSMSVTLVNGHVPHLVFVSAWNSSVMAHLSVPMEKTRPTLLLDATVVSGAARL